jgi:hypothetical protein
MGIGKSHPSLPLLLRGMSRRGRPRNRERRFGRTKAHQQNSSNNYSLLTKSGKGHKHLGT